MESAGGDSARDPPGTIQQRKWDGRGAIAVNLLAKAGFKNAYNVVDGMEGDKVNDPASLFHGMPMRNGWKNSGLPSTYHLTPDRMLVPRAG